MDDRTITLILRLIHILAGIFWVGTAFVIAGFLVPTLRETGAEGGRFVQHLMQRRRLQIFLGLAMLLTLLSGFIMYARMASATHGAWPGTRQGIVFGIGGLAAILGAVAGSLLGGGAARRMALMSKNVGPQGPSPEQQAEIARLQARMSLGTRLSAAFLTVAAGAMAIGRYL